ncbi:hypothetical protein ANDA3_2528 [plant metagenome]|uniref:Uncharacterized protein n=2 Tax=root TaxID=1 RepID=A0A1C3K757_9BURK|nr:hypothetical protein ODI_03937 [Orrella dioscoreae]SOE50069.1 hypothetical protein ODI_R2488 [Orrella dioscoreae]
MPCGMRGIGGGKFGRHGPVSSMHLSGRLAESSGATPDARRCEATVEPHPGHPCLPSACEGFRL